MPALPHQRLLTLRVKNSQIATLVERHTRYAMLVKVSRKDTEMVIYALIKHARKLPEELYKSLTWDRGKEMADHKHFTLATDITIGPGIAPRDPAAGWSPAGRWSIRPCR